MVSRTRKRKAKKKIYLETILVFFIALSPFLYKIYEYVPLDENGVGHVFGFEISTRGFEDASTYLWFLTSKVVPLYLLVLWFLTAKNWWYHIILIPIAMYAFQIFEVAFVNDDTVDTANLLWLLPICMIVIPFVYFIRIKLYDKYVHGIDLEAMEAELEEIKKENESHGFSSTTSNKKSELDEELKPKSISEEIDRKLSTNNIEQGLKLFQDKLQNWFNFKF
ncbi:hypothetical protein [Maribacter cobaltidurans]|uniref:Uncharacterized protein n=1 Tax=Maribacter cobaltidurans TaxID=1178778 RepID=A0A223V9S3_9FLAO|nr:hypothetical protein [Maribacter cobaltidurans]ASV32123.1 hypothetical protein CJ263_18920 [Maribacter cobaltidurans]GGD91596.1 hypothetical protein GCM10011412_31940 [Maribacter cobaltidurans]